MKTKIAYTILTFTGITLLYLFLIYAPLEKQIALAIAMVTGSLVAWAITHLIENGKL